MDVERVAVVGGGIMGSGIAEVCARAGVEVILLEAHDDRVTQAAGRVNASLDRACSAGKLDVAAAARARAHITYTSDMTTLHDRQLVVEAVAEDEALKLEVFAKLDSIVSDPEAVLASNTSSIPIMKLAMATGRRDRVIGLHFFNPVPILSLVEVIPSLLTSEDTVHTATQFVAGLLGKHAIRSQDRAGFVVNALLVPYLLSAIRMLESGFATADDIDEGMVRGAAHPMGPLSLADLIGLDTTMAVAQSLYEEFKEPLFAPPPLLSRMVDAGLLGRKSGRGFRNYD
jgi:3-hydroxybutyryl-CoA dehydrogenase